MRLAIGFGLAGLALATALVAYEGIATVFAALSVAGLGIVWASLFHIVPMACNARAWHVLIGRGRRPNFAYFSFITWLRESINGLLPVARIGGEVVAVRLLMQHGVRTPSAVASIVVDMTLCLATQLIYTLIGLALLVHRTADLELTGTLGLGLAVLAPFVVAFFLIQHYGLFTLLAGVIHRLFGDRFARLVGGAAALDRSVKVIYRRPRRLLSCGFWQFAAWVLTSGEIYLALHFLGHPISLADALLIDAVVHAASSAVFFVPGAIGVQEGAFVLIGGLLGLTPELALALALARRARDLLVFLPALFAWQAREGRRLLATA
jgi:putative membrane protein